MWLYTLVSQKDADTVRGHMRAVLSSVLSVIEGFSPRDTNYAHSVACILFAYCAMFESPEEVVAAVLRRAADWRREGISFEAAPLLLWSLGSACVYDKVRRSHALCSLSWCVGKDSAVLKQLACTLHECLSALSPTTSPTHLLGMRASRLHSVTSKLCSCVLPSGGAERFTPRLRNPPSLMSQGTCEESPRGGQALLHCLFRSAALDPKLLPALEAASAHSFLVSALWAAAAAAASAAAAQRSWPVDCLLCRPQCALCKNAPRSTTTQPTWLRGSDGESSLAPAVTGAGALLPRHAPHTNSSGRAGSGHHGPLALALGGCQAQRAHFFGRRRRHPAAHTFVRTPRLQRCRSKDDHPDQCVAYTALTCRGLRSLRALFYEPCCATEFFGSVLVNNKFTVVHVFVLERVQLRACEVDTLERASIRGATIMTLQLDRRTLTA
jgi:hypothetical protein